MPDQFLSLLEQKRPMIETVLGGDAEHKKRFIALALNAILKNPDFLRCTAESKVQCVIDAATCELELGTPDKLAYLIDYAGKLQFSPSYVGMIKRLKEAGACADIYAELVRDGDELIADSGTSRKLVHRLGPINKRGEIVGAYALATLGNGLTNYEILEMADIHAIERAAIRIQKKESPAWREFRGEMIKKSAIRRLCKRLPGDVTKQDKVAKLRAAIEADNKGFDLEVHKVDATATTLDDIADTIPANEPVPKEDPFIDLDQQSQVESLIINAGWTSRQISEVLKVYAGVDTVDQIKLSQFMNVLKAVTEAAESKREADKAKEGVPKQ
jgi:recombination protein RecT